MRIGFLVLLKTFQRPLHPMDGEAYCHFIFHVTSKPSHR
jgi:hypothetical protein